MSTDEEISRVQELRDKYRFAEGFVELQLDAVTNASRYVTKTLQEAIELRGQTTCLHEEYQIEAERLGREAGADEHCNEWLKKFEHLPPEVQAKAIQGLLNVAMDTIRENSSDEVFLGQCFIYVGRYQAKLKSICGEHGLERVGSSFFRKT